MGAGNQTLVFCKSSYVLLTVDTSLQPQCTCFVQTQFYCDLYPISLLSKYLMSFCYNTLKQYKNETVYYIGETSM